MSDYHISVLLKEAIDALQIKAKGKYIDATLGGAGHAQEIMMQGGCVLGIDQDEDAIVYVKEKYESEIGNKQLVVVKGNFINIDELASKNGFEKVNGIIFDIGVSGYQLDTGTRGFSFRFDSPLDMRMDKSLQIGAKELINGLNAGELYELFTKLGEEHFAKRISKAIIVKRKVKQIETTQELANIVLSAYPRGYHQIHPATKVFQALRMAVNDELGSLRDALPKAIGLLEKGSRMVVLSFHSLEDAIVKNIFKDYQAKGIIKNITEKPVVPSEIEKDENVRSRSAKMRIAEKI